MSWIIGGPSTPVYAINNVDGRPIAGGSAMPVYVTNLSSGAAVSVGSYGAVGDGTTNDTAAIQAAINALPSAGGVVLFDAAVYVVNGTLTITDKECVLLLGKGAEHGALYSSSGPTKGTVLKRVSGAGTLLSVGASTAAASSSGIGVESLTIDGNNLAATGLLITSVYGGLFKDLHIRNCTTVALDTTTVDLAGLEDTQACVFERITIRQVESTGGIGMRLGSAAAGLGNTSLNSLNDVLILHTNGVGLKMNDCDGNRLNGILVSRSGGGAGIGVELGAATHASSGHARNNMFTFLQPGAGGVTARSTGFTKPSQNNTVFSYSLGNSSAVPAIEAGASLYWITDTGLVNPALRPNFRIGARTKDDFQAGTGTGGAIGELGWALVGTYVVQASVAGHPGFGRLSTGTSSGTISYLRLGNTGTAGVHSSDLFDVQFVVRLNTNDADTAVRFGISDNPGVAPPANGLFIEKETADTSWFGVARSGSVQSRTAALASTSTNWVKLRIRRIDASTIGYSVDDGAEATLTNNIPSAALTAIVQIRNNAAADKTVDVDYFEMIVSGISR